MMSINVIYLKAASLETTHHPQFFKAKMSFLAVKRVKEGVDVHLKFLALMN